MQSNEVRIPKGEFDFSPHAQPCQYFKSSFAKSLTFCTNQTKSLDLEMNFKLHEFDDSTEIKIISPPSLDFMTSRGTAGAINAARSLLFPLDNSPDKACNGSGGGNAAAAAAGEGGTGGVKSFSTFIDVNGNPNDEDDDEVTPTVEQLQNNVWVSNINHEPVTIIQVRRTIKVKRREKKSEADKNVDVVHPFCSKAFCSSRKKTLSLSVGWS